MWGACVGVYQLLAYLTVFMSIFRKNREIPIALNPQRIIMEQCRLNFVKIIAVSNSKIKIWNLSWNLRDKTHRRRDIQTRRVSLRFLYKHFTKSVPIIACLVCTQKTRINMEKTGVFFGGGIRCNVERYK